MQLEGSLSQKKVLVKKLDASYATVKAEHTENQKTLTTAEELLQTLLTGLSSSGTGNSGGGGYMGQLADAKAKLAQATAEEEQSRVKLGMGEKELKVLEGRWKEVEREAGDGKKNFEKVKAETEKFKRKVEESGWSAEKERGGVDALRAAKGEERRLTEVSIFMHVIVLLRLLRCLQERDAVKQRLASLDFQYSTPSPSFDRSKVKGLVASLISLEPHHYNKSTALEITAGAKLYNVVVENEMVGSELLKNGKLKKRVTIIPLNKINAFKMSAQVSTLF